MKYFNKPLVSVLITVYNDEKFIEKAIQSILCQSFQNFEIIIVNDGSTDKTRSIIEKLQKNDSRIIIVNQDNQGTTHASNNGLRYCSGKYIARLDSDDYSYSNRLQIEVDYLESNPNVVLVGGGCHVIDINGNIIGERNIVTTDAFKTLIHRCIFQQSDVMFRKESVLSVGGYRDKFRNAQDYDLWLRLSEIGEVAKLNTILGVWRLNPGGYTLSRKLEQKAEVKIIKQMANLRRKKFNDGYDQYQPKFSLFSHRKDINKQDYDLLIVQFLLKSNRIFEARKLLCSKLSLKISINVVILYIISFSPGFILKLANSMREFYLNNLK